MVLLFPHFTDKETKAERLTGSAKIKQMTSHRVGTQIRILTTESALLLPNLSKKG